jgi:glucose/arabinose dehydrogenase
MRRLVLVVVAALVVSAQPATATPPPLRTATVQDELSVPWDVAFAPSGKMLVTERPGRIRVFADRSKNAVLVHTREVPNVRAEGEAGLMGIAITRKVGKTFVFVCASRTTRRGWRNQVLRYTLGSRGVLRFDRRVLGKMKANTFHNGCAVEMGPDGKVWVSMGDAGDLATPQDRGRRNGKILRINTDGSIPDDNPIDGSPVYARGFRNPQGIAFRPGSRRPFVVDHGPDVHDEINRVRPGRNYGWPCWVGPDHPGPSSSGCGGASSYRPPIWSSGGSTIATSNGAFATGDRWRDWRRDFFVATLKESDLRRFTVNRVGDNAVNRSTLFNGRWGRLRAVVPAPGGQALYLTTSNGGNDRVIRVRATR